ncbi:MAG: hypothetical protein ACRYG4_24695 [Janthinobacterium lividum]
MDEDEVVKRNQLQAARRQRRDDFLSAREVSNAEAAPALALFAAEAVTILAKRLDRESGSKQIATQLIVLIRRIEEDFDLDGSVLANIRERLG